MSAVPRLRDRVWELAGEVGRLRRGVDPDSSLRHAVDRAAGHVADLDLMLRPSAAQLVAWTYPGDQEAIEEAIRLVDESDRVLRSALGLPEPCTGRPWKELNEPLTEFERASWRRLEHLGVKT